MFAIQYVDQDLQYSKPTLAAFTLELPSHANAAITVPGSLPALGLLGWAFVARLLYTRKRREAAKLREQLLKEEHKARETLESKNQQLEEARPRRRCCEQSQEPVPRQHEPRVAHPA